MSCPLCHGRAAGCPYCKSDEDSQELLEELQWRVDHGELEIVEVATVRHDVFVVRHNSASSLRARLSRKATPAGPRPCRAHLWAFDQGDFQRRHCTRPGCGARQRWVWLPDDSRRQGEWVEEPAVRMGRRRPTRPIAKSR